MPRITAPLVWLFVTAAARGLGAAPATPPPVTAAARNPNAPVADSIPMIRSWTGAKFPAEVAASVARGSAVIRFVVDETGAITQARVLKASAPPFGEAALAALKQWTFSAAIVDGNAAATSLDVPFNFERGRVAKKGLWPEQVPTLSPLKGAEVEAAPLGEFPESLVGRGLPGDVVYLCTVDTEGRATGLRVIEASHADFVLPAIAASRQWRFKVAKQGDLVVPAPLQGDVTYMDPHIPPRQKVLEVNGITAPDGSAPDAAPQPTRLPDPVWPYNLLLNGEGGSAAVEFTVGANGVVRDVKVREATNPEFGAALAAATEASRFNPAMANGQGVDVTLVRRFEFKPVAPGAADDGPWLTRLVAQARAKAVPGGRGLDARLTPLYRVPPVSPGTLPDGTHPKVVIEFVVDRDGRARLPHIVSAEREECGWAAATAISQWVFVPPTRGGAPTTALVRIPMDF